MVTDHNSIDGALEAYRLAPDLIIVGEEIKTTQGEFLAAFVTTPLPKRLEPQEALKRLKDQGAFISVSHPFDPARSGWSLEALEWPGSSGDAIEVLNARVIDSDHNRQALEFAQAHNLPGNAGSDGIIHQKLAVVIPSYLIFMMRSRCVLPCEVPNPGAKFHHLWFIFTQYGQGLSRAQKLQSMNR